MPSCSDHEVLLSVASESIRHWCGVRAGWELRLPKLFSVFDIEAANVGIGRPGDEYDAACGNNGTTETDRSRGNLLFVGTAKILHRTERYLPANFPFVHVDCREKAPRRRATRQIRRRLQEAAEQTVRSAGLVPVVAVFGVRAALIIFRAGDQARARDEIVGVRDEQAVLRVECVAAPGHPADVAGHHQCSL